MHASLTSEEAWGCQAAFALEILSAGLTKYAEKMRTLFQSDVWRPWRQR